MKQLHFCHYLFAILALLVITSPVNAADTKEPSTPFGIRVYETGQAPDFRLKDIDGEPFELNSTRGKWVFLHFWASWCGPCREEMPAIQKLSETIDVTQLPIIMINTAEDEDTIFSFLGEVQVEINSLMDADGQVTEVWKPRGLPTTFLIDPEGYVRYQAIGGRDWHKPEYVNFLQSLIDKK